MKILIKIRELPSSTFYSQNRVWWQRSISQCCITYIYMLVGRAGLKPIGPHAWVIYSRLFKYTQHTAGFTENSIVPCTSKTDSVGGDSWILSFNPEGGLFYKSCILDQFWLFFFSLNLLSWEFSVECRRFSSISYSFGNKLDWIGPTKLNSKILTFLFLPIFHLI